jgi:hypothetical protein
VLNIFWQVRVMKKEYRRRRKSSRRSQQVTGRQAQRPVQYPIATLAYYGPDDQTVTKITVGIFEAEDAEPILERWSGPDVMTNPEVQMQIAGFIEAHGVQEVAVTDDVVGCPHEEGIDFPAGQECPYCPFWRGKQGIQVAEATQDAGAYPEMKALTRQHVRLVWEASQLDMPVTDEDARLVRVMRDHPEYSDLWGRLDELADEEIEREGVNPVLHITIHSIIENQIAEGNPEEVRQVVVALMRQGLTRHEAIHRVGKVVSDEIFRILQENRPFDERSYIRRLQRLAR